jgi:hypothetical protein
VHTRSSGESQSSRRVKAFVCCLPHLPPPPCGDLHSPSHLAESSHRAKRSPVGLGGLPAPTMSKGGLQSLKKDAAQRRSTLRDWLKLQRHLLCSLRLVTLAYQQPNQHTAGECVCYLSGHDECQSDWPTCRDIPCCQPAEDAYHYTHWLGLISPDRSITEYEKCLARFPPMVCVVGNKRGRRKAATRLERLVQDYSCDTRRFGAAWAPSGVGLPAPG